VLIKLVEKINKNKTFKKITREAWRKEGMGWDAPIESISRLPQHKKQKDVYKTILSSKKLS